MRMKEQKSMIFTWKLSRNYLYLGRSYKSIDIIRYNHKKIIRKNALETECLLDHPGSSLGEVPGLLAAICDRFWIDF